MRYFLQTELAQSQKQLEGQLKKLFQEPLGPPARRQLANCFAMLYKTGKSFTLNETINRCCDTLKTKTDEAGTSLNNKLYEFGFFFHGIYLFLQDIYRGDRGII